MSGFEWEQALEAALGDLHKRHLHRHRRVVRATDATHVEFEGCRYLSFASNDYLGLSWHPAVRRAAAEAMEQGGAGGRASPLITGYGPIHAAAEERFANWKGFESCVLLPSGYQANHAAVGALMVAAEKAGRPLRFLLDKLCHASLIDAVRACGAPFRVFPHQRIAKLQRLLESADANQLQVVATESIFSMDGDAADLRAVAELKARRPFVLLLDEAHATGVYGPTGSGLAAELNLRSIVDVEVFTLSKALGSGGGAVCGTKLFCESLVNFARAYIYSTSLAPALAAAAHAAVDVIHSEPQRQQRLRSLSQFARQRLSRTFSISRGDSPIIPVVLGTESAALDAAATLMAKGIFVQAIRQPTVAPGSSRLRITLCSEHTQEQVGLLVHALESLGGRAASGQAGTRPATTSPTKPA